MSVNKEIGLEFLYSNEDIVLESIVKSAYFKVETDSCTIKPLGTDFLLELLNLSPFHHGKSFL